MLSSLDTTKIHLCTDSKDLNCPICYCTFGLDQNHPISINCGHTICSICFDRVNKCPFCKQRFHKRRQKHQKSVFISSLIANSAKINTCKEHEEVCQGFCEQDKAFVCFDCVTKSHHGHRIITIKEIQEKAEKTRAVLQKSRTKRDAKNTELKNSLEAESKRQKRQLDEIIDQEISHLSMLKKKLYKEVDIRMISEKEHYEHQLLSENLSKYCKSTEALLENWNKNQEVPLALQILEAPLEEKTQEIHQKYENQIDFFKAEIPKKHVQIMNVVLENLSFITPKFRNIFFPNKKADSSQNLPQVEIDYLISVFQEYNFIASQKSGFLELKVSNNIATAFTPKFDPENFTCSLPKISLNCLDVLPSSSFMTIWQILQNIQGLKDVTLHLQKLKASDLIILFNIIFNLKNLERFTVQMDLTDIPRFEVGTFTKNLANINLLHSLEIQHKTPHTIISFQLIQSFFNALPLTTLQEISLDLQCIPEVCGILHTLNSSQIKYLKILKLSLGKTECNPQVFEAVRETLIFQSDLQELVFICEELTQANCSDLSKLLTASTQRKKLAVFVNRVMIRDYPTKFLPKAHTTLQDLEEFTLKIKYEACMAPAENFAGLIDFLSSMKAIKKLCLQFDKVEVAFDYNYKLFSQVGKLNTLTSLEIEHIHAYGLPSAEKRVFERLLNRLPGSVTKKLVFKRSEERSPYDDGWDEDSEYSGYSDEEADYLQDDEEIYG